MATIPLSIGKFRRLQQCSTLHGAIAVLALDHRNNLRAALNPADPSSVANSEMSAFKIEVIQTLSPASSAVLLDPEVGAPQCIAAGALPGSTGLLISVEATGYTGDPGARKSQVLPGWSVAKVRRMGASAVKMLVYYHPEAPTAAEIALLVRQVAADCKAADLPLFLETLSYSPDPTVKKLPPAERRRVVIETARQLVIPGVDVLKAEFPLDIKAEGDETVWANACAELSGASVAPWVLLSASVDYATFLRQVTVACQAGASGVAVGRAVWQEAPALKGQERHEFLTRVARPRMARVTALVDALAKPWSDFYSPEPVSDRWYPAYPEG
jgi:tagatose 1,6-diphosphate aldolase